MSYILRNLSRSVIKLACNSCKCRNDLLLKNKPGIVHFVSNYVRTQAREKENVVINQQIQKLDNDARRQGRLAYKDVKGVFEVIKATRSASITQALMIIRCCGHLLIEEPPEKRTKLVQEMWKTLETLGVSLDISHYNALLRVYLENEYDFTPTDILADLEKRGLEPNRVTYQRLIMRYCQKGDIDGATRILEFMREKEMPVNVTVFNALILGHSQSNDMANAEGILNVMKRANIHPTAETYTQLICGYIKQGDLDKVKDLLQTYETADPALTDKDYFDIIYCLAKYGYEEEVDKVISKLRRISGYNHEATNSIFRLLTVGKADTAFKILKTMVRSSKSDGSTSPLGAFFISRLVRSNFPPETVIEYCLELMKNNMNGLALNIAMDNSLRLHQEQMALSLFRKAKEIGISLKHHFFWPLLVHHGKNNNKSGIFDILAVMYKEFDLPANTETLREYVMPYVLSKNVNIDGLLMDLKSCGCSVAGGVSSIVNHYLFNHELQNAASVAQNYKAYYSPFIMRRSLVQSFLKTPETVPFVSLLREIGAGIHWRSSAETEKVDDDELSHIASDYRETISLIVVDVIKELKKDSQFSEMLQNLFEEMLSQGVGLTSSAAKEIQQILQNQLTTEISELLEKLTSDEFASAPTSAKGSRISIASLDEKSLERLYDTIKANNESLTTVRRQLFLVYARNKNMEKLLQIKEELDAEGFVYSTGMTAMLIDAFVDVEKLDEALKLFSDTCEKHADFNLNPVKLLRLALLLVRNDQVEKALEILNRKCDAEMKDIGESGSFVTSSLCWRIMNIFAEKGDSDKVSEFFNLFIERELTEVNNILLGPLIKVHIQRDDLNAAMETFEMCCEKYRATPWKNELARIFIEKEDATNLQKLTDLSAPIHGEVNSLYDLMLSFLECGRIRQAKKILETPGLRFRQDRLQNACSKYTNEGAVEHLENLLALTKGISLVNRSEMYYNMLQAYDRMSNPHAALGLWMQMQEEDVQPSDQFLYTLADVLKRHNLPIPFSPPSKDEIKGPAEIPSREQSDKIRVSRSSQTLRKFLNSGDVDKALESKKKIGVEKLNTTDWSLLIEGCLKQNRYKDAVQLTEEFYSRSGRFPHVKYLKFFISVAAKNGDVELINSLKNRLSEEMQAGVTLENYRVQAYSNANKIDVYLDELDKKAESIANETGFQDFERLFPRMGLVAFLIDNPDYEPKIRAIHQKCLEKGYDSISFHNFWWSYLMCSKQLDAAQKLWDEKIKNCPERIIFRTVTAQIQRNGDVQLAKKFLELVASKVDIRSGVLGIAYGSLITALVKNSEINEALVVLKEAVQKIPINSIMKSSLALLKASCEAKNISFPYVLPVRPQFSTPSNKYSSDSESD